MKFRLKDTKETNELLVAVGSKDKSKSLEAQEALGAFIRPIAQKVVEQAGTSNLIFKTETYNIDDAPSIPLDLFFNEQEGYVTVWQQPTAGGLATNQTAGVAELKIADYRLDCAMSILKKWARRSRLDVVSKSISKMLNEVLIKQEINAWTLFTRVVAEASTNGLAHVIDRTTADVFQLDDLNRLITRNRRINTAFNAGTPAVDSFGITDLFVSPEIMEQVRAFAYQPMNTRSGATTTSGATSLALPDNVREKVFNAGGVSEIYGIALNEVLELGDTGRWNRLFDNFYSGTFTHGTDQAVFAADLNRDGCIRLIAKDGDTGSTFDLQVDDQFLARSEKIGMYGSLQEARACVDARPYSAIRI